MRYDLIRQRPDVVKAWLNAELDAQLYFVDPKNAMEIVKMAREQTTGFSERALWMAAYGTYPKEGGGTPTRIILPYAFTPDAMELIKRASAFLFEIKSINSATLRPDAVMPEFAQAVLKERGLSAPLGEIKQLPDSAYTGPK
jgi:NitT/TauT family transport system substrate-binding protein